MKHINGNLTEQMGILLKPAEKDSVGTEIILKIKENTEDENL